MSTDFSNDDFLIVGIAATDSGIDACRSFLGALPAGSGMAIICHQCLDPVRDRIFTDLLAGAARMPLRLAASGMLIEPNAIYMLPANAHASVSNGRLFLSFPPAGQSERLPFDALLISLSEAYGRRVICAILSGMGADGCLGLMSVKEQGGLVIAQDLDEAGDTDMPRRAIMMGAATHVLPVEKIPAAIIEYGQQLARNIATDGQGSPDRLPGQAPDQASEVIDLLRPRPLQAMPDVMLSGRASLAEICRQLVMENYAPAAVLINHEHECLYSVGAMDRYLRVAPGPPSHDLLILARESIRPQLRKAIQRANEENTRVIVPGDRLSDAGRDLSFHIAVQPVSSEGDRLLLVCFIDDIISEHKAGGGGDGALHEAPRADGAAIQSATDDAAAGREELLTRNEDLIVLSHQLQEELEQQRTTAGDLQNLLYSTEIATLLLDSSLNIRFFTPATKALFNILAGDIGRPLADLNFLAEDDTLLSDARRVLQALVPVEREIAARSGAWYMRRILPYLNTAQNVDGVVITFADITELRRVADALEVAKRQAEMTTVAKSRFLAAASHDLRQPLQTLVLLQSLLAKAVDGPNAQKLVMRLGETVGTMSNMLNTLLDINQIEAGAVHADMVAFPINDLLDRLRDEFFYHAHASQLSLRVMPCSLSVYSDPRLLEQMIRNLLSNALKYTPRGKILLGCRRRGDMLDIEVWDPGIGIPEAELEAIFEEYYRLDTMARDRGLGLGLAIVQRLGKLLDHPIHVRSQPDRGSVFSVSVGRVPPDLPVKTGLRRPRGTVAIGDGLPRTGTILVVEDDPEVRELLHLLLRDDGHRVITAADGIKALELLPQGLSQPDLILADYNLPNGLNGLQLISRLREYFQQEIPVIILTGDISTDTLRNITLQRCVKLNKPVKSTELKQTLQRFLPITPPSLVSHGEHGSDPRVGASAPIIYVVDDDDHVRAMIRSTLEDDGRIVEDFDSCEAFLNAYRPAMGACLVIDAYLPGMTGLQLLQRLHEDGHQLPSVMITGNSDVPVAVQAMKAGVSDFIEKPVGRLELLASIDRALEQSKDANKLHAWRETAANHVAYLTPRQRQIMELVLAGQPSKIIAADLGISQRTVESHRAAIMKKTGCKSLPALARLALAAASSNPGLYLIQRGTAEDDETRQEPPPDGDL